MDTAVVDLTDSPPSPTLAAPSQSAVLTISSDEEDNAQQEGPRDHGVPPLPLGFVLPPIRLNASSDRQFTQQHNPERITTLREVLLSGRRSNHNRRRQPGHVAPRTVASRVIPPLMSQPPIISNAPQHTGEEPILPNVYNPIRARPLLPSERQQRYRSNHATAARSRANTTQSTATQPPPVNVAGRVTADGSIDVEEVDASLYNQIAARAQVRQQTASNDAVHIVGSRRADSDDDMDTNYSVGESVDDYTNDDLEDEDIEDDDMSATGEYNDGLSYLMAAETDQRWLMQFFGNQQQQQLQQQRTAQRANAGRRGARGPGMIFPFHPGLLPHHFLPRNARMNPFDFFPGEDISDLLTFLEANGPPPPSAPLPPPLPPLELTKQQEELASTQEYSRKVPEIH
ncbi:hypothetical protein GGI07_004681 [Coemansia sp. Benny D115]|nr:hypothetical protein GGI07_004681 [Coemansia sp. Benny D115]